ncbi:hypothetical protein MRY87_10145 [bacterium]|nr:hypothetical protein [bacterium]
MNPYSRRQSSSLLLAGTSVACALFFLLPALGSSLWLDETVTAWILEGEDIPSRVATARGPSALYYQFLALWSALFGTSELSLRTPSVLAVTSASFLIGRLVLLRSTLSLALFASVFFSSIFTVVQAGSYARPYGLAVFAVVAAFTALSSWCQNPMKRTAICFLLSMALAVHAHFLSLLVLPGFLAYYRSCAPPNRSTAKDCSLGALALLLLLLPALTQFSLLFQDRGSLGFAPPPQPIHLLNALLPLEHLLGLLLALAIARSLGRGEEKGLTPPAGERRERIPLLLWYLLPAMTLYLVSTTTPLSLFVSRYMVWSTPALTLLLARGADSFLSLRQQKVFFCSFLLFITSFQAVQTEVFPEDWRGAFASLREKNSREQHPVFIYTGIAHAECESYKEYYQEIFGLITAPASYYGASGPVFAVPQTKDLPVEHEYWEKMLFPILRDFPKIFLVVANTDLYSLRSGYDTNSITGLLAEMEHTPLILQDREDFGTVSLLTLKRMGPGDD